MTKGEHHAEVLSMLADLRRRMPDAASAGSDAVQIDALEAGAAALRHGWQDIAAHRGDTAPVLLGWPSRLARDGFQRQVGQWNGGHWVVANYQRVEPTHFMPILPPPEAP